jgi:hypothetical protein
MVMDASAIVAVCYDQADLGSWIDYRKTPASLHDRIAVAAYYLWQREGCPEGRAEEHWNRAFKEFRDSIGAK